MYCRNCGTEIPPNAIACGKCGWNPRQGKNYCWNCGAETDPQAIMCVKCGASLEQNRLFQGLSDQKLIIGLVAIFLGSLGIHKFMLGYNHEGMLMLAGTVLGGLLGSLLSFLIVPALLLVLPFAMGLIGIIEGIIYLTKSEAEFESIYLKGRKVWF